MSDFEWRHVPVGIDAERWVTRPGCRTVLVIVHTVTTGQRLLDAVRLVEDDLRIQVVFTIAPDVFNNGVEEFLRTLGGIVVPWHQAIKIEFHVALAAALGATHEVHGPLVVLPHGVGYNKLVVRQEGKLAVGSRVAYDLDTQRLVHDGTLVPAVIALSHHVDRARLARTCPEATPVAEVVGDPCYDRLIASLPARAAYRRALGVAERQKLVVVTSTWGPNSLLGRRHDVLPGLVAQLPPEQYRVLALIHPNAWYAHGTWQVRTWLAGCLRQGLSLLPPEADWRAALVAADWIVGDHGSVTVYGTVVGAPLLLAGFPTADIDPASAAARLAASAPRLEEDGPFPAQLRRAAAIYHSDQYQAVVGRITSKPGRFNVNMRRLIYRTLGLSQPATIPATEPVSPLFLSR